jgi:predicted dehydrogenase
MKDYAITRRAFLAAATTSAAVAASAQPNTARVVPRKVSPNEQLNVAGIGVGGKGLSDIMSCRRENIVALCDVDTNEAGEAFYRNPEAKQYRDYRKMLEEMGDQIDACTISTPDHMHAPAAYMAMMMGKHVYVQKPLTHTIAEARLLTETARKQGVATQMGNQGHSGSGVRELCEMVWDGAIGQIREAHVWTDRPGSRWPQGVGEMPEAQPVPESLDWDLWIGAAPMRPYHRDYAPRRWRGWWDFGCGALGDMACHIMDPAFWALKLADAPTISIEAIKAEQRNDQTCPLNCIIKFSYPARGEMNPVDVYWYENGQTPKHPVDLPVTETLGDGKNGSLFIGENGYLTSGEYGGKSRLLPESRMNDYQKPAATIPRVANHYRDWLDACKGGKTAPCSNFDYAGPFTQMVLLGNVAARLGRVVTWNAAEFCFPGDDEANALISKPYRQGWELPC